MRVYFTFSFIVLPILQLRKETSLRDRYFFSKALTLRGNLSALWANVNKRSLTRVVGRGGCVGIVASVSTFLSFRAIDCDIG